MSQQGNYEWQGEHGAGRAGCQGTVDWRSGVSWFCDLFTYLMLDGGHRAHYVWISDWVWARCSFSPMGVSNAHILGGRNFTWMLQIWGINWSRQILPWLWQLTDTEMCVQGPSWSLTILHPALLLFSEILTCWVMLRTNKSQKAFMSVQPSEYSLVHADRRLLNEQMFG